MTTALTRSVGGPGKDRVQSTTPWAGIPITTQRKEAVLRALSGLEAIKRKSEPEVAHEVVERLLAHCIDDHPLPPLICGFLNTHWRCYMTQLYLLEGEEGHSWLDAIENTQNLSWSVQPKADDADRQRFYDILPELFQWLHAVLASQQVAVPDEDAFFAELSRLHVASLHPRGHAGPAPAAAPRASAVDAADTGGREAPDPDKEAAAAAEPPAIDQVSRGTVTEAQLLRDLVVGALVEFQSERATKRVLRLEWISRRGGVYLFRDQNRGDALCLTVARCIQCLRERSASILGRPGAGV